MNFVTEMIIKFRDLIKENVQGTQSPSPREKNLETKADQNHVMTDDEKIDEAVEESFPASDPPGHISKSAEDLKQY